MNDRKTHTRNLDGTQFAAFSREMERRMEQLLCMKRLLEQTKTAMDDCREPARTLYDWYFKGSWLQDRDREEKHPLKQPAGVYSEDGLYDLFQDLEDLCRSVEEAVRDFRLQMNPENGDGEESRGIVQDGQQSQKQ